MLVEFVDLYLFSTLESDFEGGTFEINHKASPSNSTSVSETNKNVIDVSFLTIAAVKPSYE
jgi:hypothetical protein